MADRVALTSEVYADPLALAEKLGTAPIHRVELPDGMPSVLITGNREAREALADPRLVRSITAAAPELHKYHPLASDAYPLSRHMLFTDPPDHARARRLVSKAFTRRRVEKMRPRVQEITDGLIDAIAPLGSADLVQALALPLPIAVISEMLGVPFEDRVDFERHAETLTGINASAGFDAIIEAGHWFDGYLAELVARRTVEPRDDLISAMIAAQEQDDRLTDLEIRSNALLLLSAGFETTVNLVANGVLALLRNPAAVASLQADPSLMPGAVDEVLRFDSPVSSITYHFAREAVTIGDFEIQPGEHVVISAAAANHDPAVFTDPHRLDIRRETTGQLLSFSHGIHFCLGAPLARLEGEIAFGTLFSRLKDVTLAVPVSELTWKPSFVLHRLSSLPVTFA
ncbi:cytochrome P450 [Allocatelliglobosispora scoriae]|uniref:Cytochrome P450 n=1 Tax=Allocatelliglobosispora scoriae TaxID=643052 RepID=A0A841BTF0_9ACTN|nr:cytochrome P450 [Allocatelliglobosispora scoriae]MBB5870060.1 cytochrome P450 [Allocatelliglobosispora scoriae]